MDSVPVVSKLYKARTRRLNDYVSQPGRPSIIMNSWGGTRSLSRLWALCDYISEEKVARKRL